MGKNGFFGGLFGSNKQAASNNDDKRVYAFFNGWGMMARFASEEHLRKLLEGLPAEIARKLGRSANDVVLIKDWIPKEKEYVNTVKFDGTPAFPDEEMSLCEDYLQKKGLFYHRVGDRQLLGILRSGQTGILFGTRDELSEMGFDVNSTSIVISAYIAFHISDFK